MKNLLDKAVEVNEILTRYIKIHDKIFKFSLRKIIPIKILFKAINYGMHCDNLYSLEKELEGIVETLDENNNFSQALKKYAEALLETILCLRGICDKLYKVSQGEIETYKYRQYKQDCSSYRLLVNKYMSLGVTLNEYINQ